MRHEWIGNINRSSYFYESTAQNVMLDLAGFGIAAVLYRRRDVQPDEWE